MRETPSAQLAAKRAQLAEMSAVLESRLSSAGADARLSAEMSAVLAQLTRLMD